MSEIYKKNLVAYIDLLGFKDAALNQEKADEILKILKGFKSSEKNGSTSVEKTGQITNIKMLPTITVFSDCMVMSFSEEQFDNAVSTSWWSTAFFEMLNHIQQITAFAIRNGFLIRGGITRGDLYHSDSIVFGSAMNDAYALESKEAKMPRILISKELAFDLKTDSRNKKYITMDAEDDKFYLDYLPIILSHKTDLSEKIIPLFKVTPMSRPAI